MGDLPTSVAKQGERATALIKEVAQGKTAAPAPAPQPQPQPSAPAPAASADLEREKQARIKAEQEAREAKQRYEVLQGKYNAEVPRLNDDLKALRKTAEELDAKLKAVPASPLITEKDKKEFGPDMIDMIQRASKEVSQEMLREINAAIATVTRTVEDIKAKMDGVASTVTVVQQSSTEAKVNAFWEKFDSLIAPSGYTFDELNNAPGFLDWLEIEDDFAGEPRKDLLRKAQGRLDAERAAKFFLTYAQEHPKSSAATLETQLHPEQGAGGGLTDFKEGRLWKRSEISLFYHDVTRGVYRGRDEEKRRIEADITKANKEGRVRNG